MQFKELSLHTHLIKGLEKASYFEATPVQEEVLSLRLLERTYTYNRKQEREKRQLF